MELLTRLIYEAWRKIVTLNSKYVSDFAFKTPQSVPLTQSDKSILTALENVTLHLSYP